MGKIISEAPSVKDVSVKLSLFTFVEDNVHVVYSPALDLYGYGNDEHEARYSFEVSLREYIKYTSSNKTIEQDLKKNGWKVDKRHNILNSPDVVSMLEANDFSGKWLIAGHLRNTI